MGWKDYIFRRLLRAPILLVIALILLIAVWPITHFTAEPCSDISLLFGLTKYKKRCDEEANKRDVYNTKNQELEQLRAIIDDLRRQLFTVDEQEDRQELPFNPRMLVATVQTPIGRPIPDVKVEVAGGGSTYSNSNGEFYIQASIGDMVSLESNGERISFGVQPEDLRTRKIIQIGGE